MPGREIPTTPAMSDLPFPDAHHVRAAVGWMELGDPDSAAAELARVRPEFDHSPDVLTVRWHLHSHHRDWESALQTASQLIQVAPNDVDGWIHRSFALHELRRTREASDRLLEAEPLFPEHPILRYNLACYACQLGDLDAARQWLERARQLSSAEFIREIALDDPDLAALHDEIRNA